MVAGRIDRREKPRKPTHLSPPCCFHRLQRRGQPTISVKGQVINMLGTGGRMLLCFCWGFVYLFLQTFRNANNTFSLLGSNSPGRGHPGGTGSVPFDISLADASTLFGLSLPTFCWGTLLHSYGNSVSTLMGVQQILSPSFCLHPREDFGSQEHPGELAPSERGTIKSWSKAWHPV